MKVKILILLTCLFIAVSCEKKNQTQPIGTTEIDIEHNAINSLDWEGTYEGMLPCADCEGIRIILTLHKDLTTEITEIYLKEPELIIQSKGKFSWNQSGNHITLTQDDGFKRIFKVIENALIYLNEQGNEIKGELADAYRLEKKE